MISAAPAGEAIDAFAGRITEMLERLLPPGGGPEGGLHEAMRYAAVGGGKHIRPYILATSSRMFGVPEERALRAGAAVEMVHAYSLVHDDLPAMDDDDMRRGRPACHRQFDEATAILAGDALLTQSFEVLSDPATHPSADVRCRLVASLSAAAGARGMVGGQMIDLASEHAAVGPELIARLESMKAGALIGFSAAAGAILGEADSASRDTLEAFGIELGLAFQIVDDLLDVEGDEHDLGKKVGKDADAGKATFVSAMGVDGARREARRVKDEAIARLGPFGARADGLRSVAEFILTRNS